MHIRRVQVMPVTGVRPASGNSSHCLQRQKIPASFAKIRRCRPYGQSINVICRDTLSASAISLIRNRIDVPP